MCPALRSMPIAGFGLKPGPSAIVHPGKAERPQLVYGLYHFELVESRWRTVALMTVDALDLLLVPCWYL